MCEIFPEVESCCGLASVRVGMLLIAVLSITTGAVSLGFVEQTAHFNYQSAILVYTNVSNYTTPNQVVSDLSNLISMLITFISFVFMFAGLTLLFSTLSDQEGFAQMFVWLVFLNIFLGFIAILGISFECVYGQKKCLFGNMDWLSSSTCIVALISYLLLWYYFCCVANSYVLNAHV
ncbi:hypothetical protein PYW08_009611 [Mythimna loreyi]|uniref:Uncharacterized protein n=1 Tax=Mythimna loreyi TaxID=667449 RepID=A0ACC2Q6W5_9NEOP|nr:hypothetical protein PYW08_009611 [Mythimna loreyi]